MRKKAGKIEGQIIENIFCSREGNNLNVYCRRKWGVGWTDTRVHHCYSDHGHINPDSIVNVLLIHNLGIISILVIIDICDSVQ